MLSDAGIGGAIKFQPTYPYGVRHRCFGVIRRVLRSWIGRLVKLQISIHAPINIGTVAHSCTTVV